MGFICSKRTDNIVILVNIVLGNSEANNCQSDFGDANEDGILNILDVVIVVNLILDN